ncbi:MAG: YibE/F family protein [Oscillospiraceae bacterium]
MNMLLAGILAALMLAVGKKRGARVLVIMVINVFSLVCFIFLMSSGINPVAVAVVCCVCACALVLFGVNGISQKTVSAFVSVTAVTVPMLVFILMMEDWTAAHGFSAEDAEEISYYSEDIALSMPAVAAAVLLLGFIVAAADIAVSVISGLNEIHGDDPNQKASELIKKAFVISGDIVGTTVNTLFFAYLGSFASLIIWFMKYQYSFAEIINSKLFSTDIIQILISGIGCVLVIPVTIPVYLKSLKRHTKI